VPCGSGGRSSAATTLARRPASRRRARWRGREIGARGERDRAIVIVAGGGVQVGH